MRKIPVIAGNYQQYTKVYGVHSLTHCYVNSVDQLTGFRDVNVILIGTYYERDDWNALETEIAKIRFHQSHAKARGRKR